MAWVYASLTLRVAIFLVEDMLKAIPLLLDAGKLWPGLCCYDAVLYRCRKMRVNNTAMSHLSST